MFRLEQKEYAKEKIDWSVIDYQDNQPVIDLIASKPAGVLHILDDECNFPQVGSKFKETYLVAMNCLSEPDYFPCKKTVGNHVTIDVCLIPLWGQAF